MPTPFFASTGLQPVDVAATAAAQAMDNTRIRFIWILFFWSANVKF
jgi:hypothetical protein